MADKPYVERNQPGHVDSGGRVVVPFDDDAQMATIPAFVSGPDPVPSIPPFAKLFNTAEGQLLAYMGETDDFQPAIIVIAAPINGVVAQAKLSGWSDGEAGQQRAFDALDQWMAEGQALALRNSVRSLGAGGEE